MTIFWVLIVVIITLSCGDCKTTSSCEKKSALSYLDTAIDMIAIVNSTLAAGSAETSTCVEKMALYYLNTAVGMIRETKSTVSASFSCDSNFTRRARDCSELLEMGFTTSGVYTIWPEGIINEGKSLKVYCDMQTNGGGWTLIQRRGNFLSPIDYFYKDWKSYKEGFGDIEKDFWLGNDNIYSLTNKKPYSVRFDLRDVENNTRYAEYSTFRIEDENQQYTLHVANYTGDAGDSLIGYHNNQKFTTKDRDNDSHEDANCAQKYKGGWWYKSCHQSNLNGLYHRVKHDISDGVTWHSFRGNKESLESTEIKIRPKNGK